MSAEQPSGHRSGGVDVRRLRWRCRRGMRELDQLFERRLEALILGNDDAALGQLAKLLDCEDDQLWRWCQGHERPEDAGLAVEVDAIRAARPS